MLFNTQNATFLGLMLRTLQFLNITWTMDAITLLAFNFYKGLSFSELEEAVIKRSIK